VDVEEAPVGEEAVDLLGQGGADPEDGTEVLVRGRRWAMVRRYSKLWRFFWRG